MRFYRRRETAIRRNAKRSRLWRGRPKTLEVLESRAMLAGDVSVALWQNPIDRNDVNFDHRVTPVDALVIINDLAAHGSHALAAAPQAAPLAATSNANNVFYVDVNGDNRVTPADLLIVVNELVDMELMSVSTFTTDMSDNPISSIAVGQPYKLKTVVQDIRDPVDPFPGVFAAAADVTFNAGLSSIDVNQTVAFNSFFGLIQESSLSQGRVIGYGSTSSSTPPGNSPQMLWSVVLTATNPGMQIFTPAFSTEPDHENLVYNNNNTLAADEIQYVGSMLEITGPSVSIGNVQQAEDSGTPFNFQVTLSAPIPAAEVTVTFATSDGTGPDPATTADNDYQPISIGTVTFAPGETLQTIAVTVNSDTMIEPDETFNVNLIGSSPNVMIGTAEGVGTILNDDLPPALAISDATATAGLQPSVMVFTVTLSGVITEPVTVGFATEDDTALDGIDYESQTGILTFTPGGSASQEIPVTILSNTLPRPDRKFFVNLSSQMPPEIVLDDARGIGTIVTQGISISDTSVVEGNSSTTPAVFTVSLSRVPEETVTVAFATEDGTAETGAGDYQASSGTLTFEPDGPQTQMVTVLVNGDTDPEANEKFFVNLSDATGAPIFDSQGVGTIINDDGDKVLVRLEVTDLSETPLSMDDTLGVGEEFFLKVFVKDVQPEPTGVFESFVDVTYQSNLVETVGNPIFGSFFSTFSTFRFAEGLLDDFGAIAGIVQPADPAAEQLLFMMRFKALDVGLVNFAGSVAEEDLDLGHETAVYLSDDAVPSEEINVLDDSVNIGDNVFSASDVSEPESSNIVFTVTRFLPENSTATVVFTTVDGTATAGQDYEAQSGTLTFVPGQPTSQTVTVTVMNDTIDEPDETFFLELSDPVNAAASQSPATGTIEDDDGAVDVSVGNAAALEGSELVFPVSLSAASGKTVTVAFHTANSPSGVMATAGVDYTPTSGTVTFEPGIVDQTVTVEILPDIAFEPNETFRLVLSGPENANLGTAEAQGTIIDVPPAGISGFVYVDLNDNGIKDGNEAGIPGAIVTATRESDNVAETTVTGADGFYAFLGLVSEETYTISETQPGFYNDGRDTRFGVESPVNDAFTGIELAPSASETGYNFGELGVRGEFVAAFINRRALFATATVSGFFDPTLDMNATALNLGTGEVWVSFDGGWEGLRAIEALFDSTQGSAAMRLYNNALQEIAVSAPTATGAILLFNGQLGLPYFLRISGTNPSVVVEISELALPAAISAPAGGGDDNQAPATDPPASNSDDLSPASRFATAQPMIAPEIEPLTSSGASDASDEALAENEDWILETLLA